MPLTTKMFPVMSRAARDKDKVRQLQFVNDADEPQYSDEYTEEDYDSEMMDDSSILSPSHPKKATGRPLIPQRSALRASRIFEVVTIEPQPFDEDEDAEEEEDDRSEEVEQEDSSDPLQRYLSSEEDASESADDYEESLLDLDEERSLSRSSSLSSQGDTARTVSFMFVGKASLIEISMTKPKQQKARTPRRRPEPLRLDSITSFTPPLLKTTAPKVRLRLNLVSPTISLSNISTQSNPRSVTPSFLDTDPCAASEHSPTSESTYTRPKTPNGMASAAWKTVNRSLTFGKLARRKPSIPLLNLGDKSTATPEKPKPKEPRASCDSGKAVGEVEVAAEKGPVTYEEVMRGAIRTPSLVVKERQLQPKKSMFGLGRRKSVKLVA